MFQRDRVVADEYHRKFRSLLVSFYRCSELRNPDPSRKTDATVAQSVHRYFHPSDLEENILCLHQLAVIEARSFKNKIPNELRHS